MYKLSPTSNDLNIETRAVLYEMIESRGVILDPMDFYDRVTLEDYLDDGEEFTNFLRSNPHAQFYKVEFNPGEYLYGIQAAGIDTLFTMHGKPIQLSSEFDAELSKEISLNADSWVLTPCNSIYALEHMGDEFIRFANSTLRCFDGTNGATRLQLIVDGRPVCGIEVMNDVVEHFYTMTSERDKGYPEQIIGEAQKIFQNLKTSELFPERRHSQNRPNLINEASYTPSLS